ncbi:MAG: hypothetical protein AB1400_08720 [Pseudomonadota bacterium]
MMMLSAFPKLPSLEVKWMPIYWEPILGSGEMITALIVAVSGDGWKVVPTIQYGISSCLFGGDSARVLGPIELVSQSLTRHLKINRTLDAWLPPVSGFKLSHARTIRVPNFETAIELAMRESSLFSRLSESMVEMVDQDIAVTEFDRWSNLVEREVVKSYPALASNFRKKFRLRSGARETPLDYAGTRYVANFVRIIPNQTISAHINQAKVKLLNLEALRSHAGIDQLFEAELPKFELLVYRPRDDDPKYTNREIGRLKEAFLELEDFGDRHEMRVEPLHSADAAASRLIMQEAA